MEEAENSIYTTEWLYAREITIENPQKAISLSKADELIAKAEELKKEAEKL